MGNSFVYSEGTMTGRLTKLSKSGFYWKTWEGEMISDGLKEKKIENGTTSIANTWDFSIDAKSAYGENMEQVAEQLQKKLDNGEPLTIKYWVPLIGFPCRGSTKHYVHEIK